MPKKTFKKPKTHFEMSRRHVLDIFGRPPGPLGTFFGIFPGPPDGCQKIFFGHFRTNPNIPLCSGVGTLQYYIHMQMVSFDLARLARDLARTSCAGGSPSRHLEIRAGNFSVAPWAGQAMKLQSFHQRLQFLSGCSYRDSFLVVRVAKNIFQEIC